MKILITGGAGYIGGHFVNIIRHQDHELLIVDNFCQGRNNVIEGINYANVDIRDKASLEITFNTFKPDVVAHFAALANVQNALASPAEYYDNNIVGTFNVLECMRETGCKKIIFSSTAAVYKETNEAVIEVSDTIPSTAYGYTKLVGEEMLKDYFKAYGISSISFRYFCAVGCAPDLTVGCYHTPEFQVVPNLVKTILGQQEVFNVWGNDFPTSDGSGIRDYIHVDDIAEAHILGIQKLEEKGAFCYNLGINKGFSVLELVKETERVTGKKLNWQFGPRRSADVAQLTANANKANQELGWTPKYTDIGEMIMTDYNFFKTL